ncbi:hypothetical protein [uncultured Cohaesibacter sp.]|uniref:hypothetical protein n=1 Tax=uncultured Cohaesibacter sp. TaxID=1002546 RepID=UPI0029C5FD4D|nr:hypothetical protein [uncultured Cohaesibacter sp.]
MLEELSFDDLFGGYRDRFLAVWAEEQAIDESLPDYDVDLLETDPAKIVGAVIQLFAAARSRARQ